MKKPIYLDYNASTPIAREARETMLALDGCFGNPSSSHAFGREALAVVEKGRGDVASIIGCSPGEIIFTSGGTESNNHAIKCAASAMVGRGRHLITSAIEHPSVSETFRSLEEQDFTLTILPVDGTGRVDPDDLRNAITTDTILVSVMHANNEVGTVQAVREMSGITGERGILFHTDAAQSAGKIDIECTGADLITIAGHKIYAPKGVGALFVRKGVEIGNMLHGAGHESGMRPGTENVISIAGLGAACRIALRDLRENALLMKVMRDRLHDRLAALIGTDNMRLNGHPELRLPNTLSLSFKGIGVDRLFALTGELVAASAGAACHGDGIRISPVLSAMGVPPEWAEGTVRFSTGRGTSPEEVDAAAGIVADAVLKLR